MNITQLEYIVAIVENDYNITQAAKTLFVSQPALSKTITLIEKNINFMIFERQRGRLSNLTADGQFIYQHAKTILSTYSEMMYIIEQRSKVEAGEVKIGIPPFVITTLFSEFLESVKENNPKVKVSVQEYGAHTLEEMLESEKLDFAILVNTKLESDKQFVALTIHKSEYAIFMSKKNVLAKKAKLNWSDLEGTDISIVDESYTTYHLFNEYLKTNQVQLNSLYTAHSWDYIFASIRHKNNMTFNPKDAHKIFNMNDLIVKPFEDPVTWNVFFVYRKKSRYNFAEKYLIDAFRSYFLGKK